MCVIQVGIQKHKKIIFFKSHERILKNIEVPEHNPGLFYVHLIVNICLLQNIIWDRDEQNEISVLSMPSLSK